MSSSSRHLSPPWPSQTPAPEPVPSSTRHKKPRQAQAAPQSSRPFRRVAARDKSQDVITDQQEVETAETNCQFFSSNDVFSCFPTNDTTIPQHQFSSFVWNSRLPQFAQTNLVNIYLFSATNQKPLLTWLDQQNPTTGEAGLLHAPVNDTWFGDRGVSWNGANQTFLFYWIITRNDETLDGSQTTQPIFTAVQTTFADFVVASMSSASVASAASASSASAASAASASSASLASLSSAAAASASAAAAATAGSALGHSPGASGQGTGTAGSPTASSSEGAGNVQPGGGGSSFPHWAIAVIVVLGFLALLAGGIMTFLIMRRLRNQRNSRLSHRGSMGSSTPMMQNNAPQSPISAVGGFAGAQVRAATPENDGASTMSHGSEAAPFSGADAAVMADAFRAALRKPNFTDRPVEEGESPDTDPLGNDSLVPTRTLDRELAEEGRDIRSVDSSRGVTVQSLQDTVQDQPI